MQSLLSAGATASAHSASGMTPLHEAAQAKRLAVMELLVAAPGAKLDSRNHEGKTPLHLAVKDASVVAVLLGAGASSSVQDASGSRPLHGAADTGQTEALQHLLLASRAEVNAVDRQGRTCAYLAARGGHLACLQQLLQAGADIALTRPGSGEACLHAAAKEGHTACVELLLDNGALSTVTNAEGDTALHLAAQRQHAAAVQLLLNRGARVDVRNTAGVTPSDIILQRRSSFRKELVRDVAAQQRLSRSRRGKRGTPAAAGTASPAHGMAGIAEGGGGPEEEEENVLQFQPLARNIDTFAACLPTACVPFVASALVLFDALVHFGDFWSDVIVAKEFFDSGDEVWGILAAVILGISWATTVFSVNLANSAAYSRGERGCRLLLAALGLFPAGLALGMRVVGKAEEVFFDQLRLLEVFVESIPELLLQTYVLVLLASRAGGRMDVSAAQIISLTLSLLSVANAVFDSRKADILSPSIPGLLEDVFARRPWGLLARWGVLLCTVLEVASAILLYSLFGSVFGPLLFVALGVPVLGVWAYTAYQFKRLSSFRQQNSWNDGVDSRISFLYYAGLTIVSGAGFLHGRGAARSDHLRHRLLAIRLFGPAEHDALLRTALLKTVLFLGPLLVCTVFVLRCTDSSLHVCSSDEWHPYIVAAASSVCAVHVLYLALALWQRYSLLSGSPTAPVHVKSAQSSRGKSRARGATFKLPRLGRSRRSPAGGDAATPKPLQQAPTMLVGDAKSASTSGEDSDSDGEHSFVVVVPELALPAKEKRSSAPLATAPGDASGVELPRRSSSKQLQQHSSLGVRSRGGGWSDASSASITPTEAGGKWGVRAGGLGAVSAAATARPKLHK